jgi:hypothetical protein
MLRRITALFITGLICLLALAGCGSGDSNTNGELSVVAAATDLTGGLFLVTAQATYVNTASAGALQGFPITITWTAHLKDGTQVGAVRTDHLSANSLGVVNSTLTVPQISQTIFVDVTASSGGLSDIKTVPVASNVAMTASPSVVSFPVAAIAGATQTVTVTGGLAPYSAQIDAAHVSDIQVTVSGSSIILTKLKNSAATPITATLTISDSSGATPIAVVVSYN